LLSRFRTWHAPICDLIDATSEEDILLTEISEQPPIRTWSRGGVILLGDAAHLMTPNLGQGAAMAMEDAWVLAECLRNGDDFPGSLRRFKRLRKPRDSWIVWKSRQIGKIIQLQRPEWVSLRDGLLRITPDWVGARSLAPVFDFRA